MSFIDSIKEAQEKKNLEAKNEAIKIALGQEKLVEILDVEDEKLSIMAKIRVDLAANKRIHITDRMHELGLFSDIMQLCVIADSKYRMAKLIGGDDEADAMEDYNRKLFQAF